MTNEENVSTPGSHPRRAFDLPSTPLGVVRQAQSDLALFLLATNYQLGLNRSRQRTHIMIRKPYKLSNPSMWAAEWYNNGPTAGTFVHGLHWIRGLTDKMRDEFLEYLRSEDQLGKYEEWLSGEPTAIGPDKDITSEKVICGIVYDICHDGLWQPECCHHNGEPIFEEATKEVLDGIPLGICPLSKKALLYDFGETHPYQLRCHEEEDQCCCIFGRDALKIFLIDDYKAWCEEVNKCFQEQGQQQLSQLSNQLSSLSTYDNAQTSPPLDKPKDGKSEHGKCPVRGNPFRQWREFISYPPPGWEWSLAESLSSINLRKASEDNIASAYTDFLSGLPPPKDPPSIQAALASYRNITALSEDYLAKHNEKYKDISEDAWDECVIEMENELADLVILGFHLIGQRFEAFRKRDWEEVRRVFGCQARAFTRAVRYFLRILCWKCFLS